MQEVNYAIYLGKEYLSGKGFNGKIILRSTNLEDVEKGFEECKPFNFQNGKQRIVCLKFVNQSDVDAYYKKTTKAIYAGYEYDVVEEKGNQIRIVPNQSNSRDWISLGVDSHDQNDSKWINKNEVKLKVIKENLL
ncbi:MAG: hypothetical protein Q4D32_07370 [Eubacteriales bacterium]|nr:hypothetical protein [Eubacteriales bacterium]